MSAFAEYLSAGPHQGNKKMHYKSVNVDRDSFIGLSVWSASEVLIRPLLEKNVS